MKQPSELRSRNVRMAWVIGGLAVFFLISSIPFWQGLIRVMGGDAP